MHIINKILFKWQGRKNKCCFSFLDSVSLFNNAREMEPYAVINIFSVFEGVDYLSLVCVGRAGSSQLEWEASGVERFSGTIDDAILSANDDITIDYYTSDRRFTRLELNPVTQDTVGYYTCKSTTSEYEATVLTTFQNPYFAFTSPTEYNVPFGVRVDISARYAYSSNGSMNVGAGFFYNLTFLPCLDPTDANETVIPSSSQIQILDVGITNDSTNNYVYTLYANDSIAGEYNLTCELNTNSQNTQELYHIFLAITISF